MFKFDLRGKQGIIIFTLYNYRLGEGREYYAGYSTQKRLNSYAFYNVETNDLKIVHYDSIKARVYESSIAAYTIDPGERILGLRDSSCYYVDHNGQELEYAGDSYFFYKYKIDEDITNRSDIQPEYRNKQDNELNSWKEPVFKIENNKIIYDNGEIYECDYSLKEIYGHTDIILCYTYDENKSNYNKCLWGLCDNKGNPLSKIKYDQIWTDHIIKEKYIPVKINDKFGLLSFDGKEILPVEYEFIDDCDGNIAIVNHRSELISVMDLHTIYHTDNIILDCVDGWMRVVTGYYRAKTIGLLDSKGKLHKFFEKIGYWRQCKEVKYYNTLGASFHNGLLPVFSKDRGFGYVDIDSNEVIECKYCEISDFENGKAKVRLDCEYGYINTEGCPLVKKGDIEIVIPQKYDWAYNYDNGFYVVQKKGFYGALDEYMNEIIPCSFKSKEEVEQTYAKIKLHSQSFSNTDYVEKYKSLLTPIRFEEEGLFGFKSANGELLFPPVLRVGKFVEGMAVINICGKCGYINEKLELVIPPKYNNADDFSEGLALVERHFINKWGEYVVGFSGLHENLHSFKNGVAKCEYNPSTPGKDNEDDEISKYKVGYKITT